MKKLMIAAAIVCAAAFAQAASVEWSFSQVNTPTATGALNLKDYTAYLFTADAWSTVSGKALEGKLAKADFMGYAASASITTTSQGPVTTFGTGKQQSTGTSGDYYVVLADANTGVIDYGKKAMTSYTEPTEQHDAGVWNVMSGQPTAVTYSWKTSPEPEPTPEPTSAMLMLLGVAGLALRRKQK